MKHILLYIRQIFIIVLLLICVLNEARSQGNDSIKRKKPGLYIGFSFGPSQTSIKNQGVISDSKLNSGSQNSLLGSVELGYFFSKHFGLSTGINYISYKSQLTLDAYQSNFNTTDSENDAYEMRVSGSGIKEVQTVALLSIPLCVQLRLPFSQKIGMFVKGGINIAFPLSPKYTSSGVFTYKGYYPAYNDLLENMPAYGFPTNKSVTVKGELKLKTMGVNSIVAAGLDYFVKKNMQIALGVSYNNALLGAKDTPSSTDKFQLSPDAEHINSFFGESSKSKAQAMGIEISFRYYLK